MNTQTLIRSLCAIGAATMISSSASALVVDPISYDMLNGNKGKYRYFDDIYTVNGESDYHPDASTEAAPLSGGLGKLTDGVIADTRWDVNERLFIEPDGYGYGQYVGWRRWDSSNAVNPVIITFDFGTSVTIHNITVHVDDADGVGDAHHPGGLSVNGGGAMEFIDPTPDADIGNPGICKEDDCIAATFPFVNTKPFAQTFSDEWTGQFLELTFYYDDGAGFMFLSEIEFEYIEPPVTINPTPTVTPPSPTTSEIPEPGTLAIFGLGLAGLGFARRRKAA